MAIMWKVVRGMTVVPIYRDSVRRLLRSLAGVTSGGQKVILPINIVYEPIRLFSVIAVEKFVYVRKD